METVENFRRKDESKSLNENKNSTLENILEEYCLKRTQFDPNKPSPNIFVNKLHLRMKVYYKTCSSLSSSPSKY